MNDDHNEIIAAENATDAIDVFEGIMVIAADAIDNEVTFTTASTKSTSDADQSVVLNVVNDHGHVIDRAVVRFNKDSQLPKYMLNTSNTNISIPQHNKEYAIVKAEMQGETPVNFKAGKNDSYTLHVNTQNVEMDYLHLIDNLTGADIDLLKTPNYSFNGNVSDYASRFRLIYHANGNESNTFGFISNDEIVLMGVEGNAIVQVIDAMGRIIVSCSSDVTRISTNGMSAGVYMLRVIDDNKVKTQKIIIK